MILLLTLLIASLFLYISKNIKENFLIVGYNNNNIPTHNIDTSYDKQNIQIQNSFEFINKNGNCDTDIYTYTLYNRNINFPLSNIFKSFILKSMGDDNNNISGELLNIYFKDYDSKRIFSFHVVIYNSQTFLSRTLHFKLQLNNINIFLNPIQKNSFNILPSYINDPDINLAYNNLTLLCITLPISNLNFKVEYIDYLQPTFYQIKNKYNLTEPFLTSGNDKRD